MSEGKFGTWAKKQSDWISLDYGESMAVEWTGEAKEVTGQYGDGWVFYFKTEHGEKKYTINNIRIVAQFDNYKPGEKLIINRFQKGDKPSFAIIKESEELPKDPERKMPAPF